MNNFDDMPEMFTAKQVAKIILTSTSKVYKLISTGELPSIKIGRNVRILRIDLIKYIKDHRIPGILINDEEQDNG